MILSMFVKGKVNFRHVQIWVWEELTLLNLIFRLFHRKEYFWFFDNYEVIKILSNSNRSVDNKISEGGFGNVYSN
jgi:hypothetical protein